MPQNVTASVYPQVPVSQTITDFREAHLDSDEKSHESSKDKEPKLRKVNSSNVMHEQNKRQRRKDELRSLLVDEKWAPFKPT